MTKRYYPAKNNPLSLPIETFKFEDISPLYDGHVFVEKKVLESIEKHGVLNPLIVVSRDLVVEKLDFYMGRSEYVKKDAEFYVYTGNNRYFALKQLEADYVDAYIADSIEQAKLWEERLFINPVFYEDAALGRPY